MKEIKEWEAVVNINDKHISAIPLPGCFISGEIEGRKVFLETEFVDLSKLIIKDIRWELLLSRWGKAFLFGKIRKFY